MREIRYGEDLLFNDVFPLLRRYHQIPDSVLIRRHVIINNLEIDVFLKWRCGFQVRTMILELKSKNLLKLLDQCIRRRQLADWVYGVIDLNIHTVFDIILYSDEYLQKLKTARDLGIGLIAIYTEHEPKKILLRKPIMILKSKMRPKSILQYLLEKVNE